MSYIRYGLLCWGRTNKTRINEVNILIDKALRCFHYKTYDESVRKLKITKRILNVENLFKYEVGVFVYEFKNCKDIILVLKFILLQIVSCKAQ